MSRRTSYLSGLMIKLLLSLSFIIVPNVSVKCRESEENAVACYETTISDKSVKCLGDHSCDSSDITCTGVCQMNGPKSAKGSTIIAQDLFCGGPSSCIDAKIEANNIYAYGDEGLGETRGYVSVKNKLEAYSRYSAFDSVIVGDGKNTNAYLHGYMSGYGSCFDNIGNYNVQGSYALEESNIYSGNNGITVTFDLSGHSAGNNAKIFCEELDTCEINCLGFGCDGITVYSFSTTNDNAKINCDDDTAYCDNYQKDYHMSSSLGCE